MNIKHHRIQLPHNIRRMIYSALHRNKFARMQQRRASESDNEYSLKAFDDNKCIFIHIPKTAGVSICKSLFGNLAGGHDSVSTYQIIYPKFEFDSYFKFCFIRNPWDRLFSAYKFLKTGGINKTDEQFSTDHLARYGNFEQFVEGWVSEENIMLYTHFVPQYKYICPTGTLIPAVDFIGQYENLEEDFAHISEKIFPGKVKQLPHLNKTHRNNCTDFKTAYSDKMRDIVADAYKIDIQMFGYTFDNTSLNTQVKNRIFG